ncbi:MAG: DNA-binding protein WhiA [Clostridiales bacterium]|nr:DNA-binding protein WhiA [Clostridiales bacterium]MCF8021632.1 DNA-binding protein WhiA [Clostridiales bacterium]
MSYSLITKNELARIVPDKDCCKMAELSALAKMDGMLHINGGKTTLDIRNQNAAVVRKIFSLVKELFYTSTQVLVRRKVRLRKNNVYLVRVPPLENIQEILSSLGLIDSEGLFRENIPRELLDKKCCRRSYLRGIFLGGGSINSPDRAYHMELIMNNLEHAKDTRELINNFGLSARISLRKNYYVVYLKESEQISDCLNIMGAHDALLDFENKRVYKHVRNQVNRQVNCETANLNKTVNASVRQIEDIELIKEAMGLDKLPLSLRSAAETRLGYPDASLRELGELMAPPVGKSCVNHRLRKLSSIASRLRGEGG